jgi:hypothetical protein
LLLLLLQLLWRFLSGLFNTLPSWPPLLLLLHPQLAAEVLKCCL